MKAELVISELCIDIEKETGKKYIYPSLFDFYTDTKEELDELTAFMIESSLFSFKNIGRYVGIDNKTDKYWTFDDGSSSVKWLVSLVANIGYLNSHGNSIVIKIDKDDLLDNEAVMDMASKDTENAEELIDLYVYHLKKFLKRRCYSSMLETEIEGKLSKKIKSRMDKEHIYVYM